MADNTHILTAQTPLSKNMASFLKTIFLGHPAESWLTKKGDCLGKFINEKSWLTRKVSWWGKLISEGEESQLIRKVNWREKLMNFGSGHVS